MALDVHIVGTSHVFQRPPVTRREEAEQLRNFLLKVARRKSAALIGEELSEEDLIGRHLERSTPADVALQLEIPHCYCNPTLAEQAALKIPNGSAGYSGREREWFKRLKAAGKWPVLFVCGANHVASFKKLLLGQGLGAHVIRRDWSPDYALVKDTSAVFGPNV